MCVPIHTLIAPLCLFQEKAQQSNMGAAGSYPHSNPSEPADEPIPDGSEANRLLDWPQLELERVNSFLTSRLEEIKNTIKDSIRASFSMYDLNLDVNDFPKKAATLEGNHLLSHLNGSSDLQQIDLDLAPLSLGTFKSHLDLVNGWEDTASLSPPNTTTASAATTGSKDVQRLQSTPSLSKLIRVRSPERCTSAGSESMPPVPGQATAKSKEDASDPKNTSAGNGGGKSEKKKNKKQQQRQEQPVSEQNSNKPNKAVSGYETQKANETKLAEMASNGSKAGNKQPQPTVDNQKNGPKKAEEGRSSRQAANGANTGLSNAQRGKGDAETRGVRSEQDSEGKAHPTTANGQQQQQSKGKSKKNKNKGEKSSSAIGTGHYLCLCHSEHDLDV